MCTTRRCIATAIVVVLWLQAAADARRLSPRGVIRLPSDSRGDSVDQVGDSVDQVGSSKVISIEDPFYTCPDGKVLKCKVIAFQWYCDCVREKGVGPTPTDQAMSAVAASSSRKIGEEMLSRKNSDDKGGPTDQVQVTKVLNDLEPWWPCPDGTVQKCELVAFKIYCKCVPKDGAGLTDRSMSAPAHSARKKDGEVQVTKVLNDLEPWWPCPDGTVQKCELVAFKIYCKCVPKDGAGLTDRSMSAPAHSARKKDGDDVAVGDGN